MEFLLERATDIDVSLSELLPSIAKARRQSFEEVSVADVKDSIRFATWWKKLHPHIASCPWNSLLQGQHFWDSFILERLAGGCFLGMHQGWFNNKGGSKIRN